MAVCSRGREAEKLWAEIWNSNPGIVTQDLRVEAKSQLPRPMTTTDFCGFYAGEGDSVNPVAAILFRSIQILFTVDTGVVACCSRVEDE